MNAISGTMIPNRKKVEEKVMDGYAVVSMSRSEDPEVFLYTPKAKSTILISEDMNWNEIELKEYSYSEGWLMIRYKGDGHRRYKLYPLQVASELGNERYDVGDL